MVSLIVLRFGCPHSTCVAVMEGRTCSRMPLTKRSLQFVVDGRLHGHDDSGWLLNKGTQARECMQRHNVLAGH